MVVCLCKGVSQKTLEEKIGKEEGCGLRQLMRETKAGTNCGSCLCEMRQMLAKAKKNQSPGTVKSTVK